MLHEGRFWLHLAHTTISTLKEQVQNPGEGACAFIGVQRALCCLDLGTEDTGDELQGVETRGVPGRGAVLRRLPGEVQLPHGILLGDKVCRV